MLPSPALGAQLFLLADPQSCSVQLGDLEAEEILTLGPIAVGAAEPLELFAGRAGLGVERRQSRYRFLGVGEAIEQLELGKGLEETLVFVLTVDLDELLAQPLQQPHGHGR